MNFCMSQQRRNVALNAVVIARNTSSLGSIMDMKGWSVYGFKRLSDRDQFRPVVS